MDYNKFLNILSGRFNDVPKENSKVVRIFLSSTFTDTHEERDYLIQNIYPRLKKYCKLEHGLDFQVLDMRWGISHEATNTHMATTICLNEVKTAQKLSIGPNFIVLLSHRYGNRCLPTRIIADEFDILRKELNEHHLDILDHKYCCKIDDSDEKEFKIENLLEDCYELDDNEIPARYKLKYISSVLSDYQEKNGRLNEIWNEIEEKLGNLLRSLANICFEKKLINKTQHERYFVSVTEKEIYNGILNAKNVNNNVLFFVREIEDIHDNIKANPTLAARFIDLNKKKEIDEEAQKLLDELKFKKIPSKLQESNIFRFKVKWNSSKGVAYDTHPSYMKEFGETFYQQVKLLIDRNKNQKSYFENLEKSDKDLIQEVLDHAYFCNDTVEKFHGRSDLLMKMKEYLLNRNQAPLIIYGESGCGKTAILAKLTSEILKTVPDPQNYSIILRFLGTTPGTSNIESMLKSVIHQIARLFNFHLPHRIQNANMNVNQVLLRNQLYDQLVQITSMYPNKKLVIVLDSIDQLQTCDYTLEWFLNIFPENIKMIYSTLPEHGEILNRIRKYPNLEETNYIQLKDLELNTVKEILNDWLRKAGRSLSKQQWDALNSMFEKASIFPLYIKLIYDIICKWPSFYEPDADFKKCLNIDACIQYLFKMLERDHGALLFSRAIIYMSTFKNGISESEIEDILSLDDDVLYDIFEFHEPPVRKLPVALWSRIKYDLKGYMVEKEVDDVRVIYWYHRRFIETANSYYISKLSSTDRQNVFSNVVDLFNETWKNKPKPYKYNQYLTKKKKLNSSEAQAIRDTSIQPTVFVDSEGNMRVNRRKINELPSFISELSANLAMPLGCENIYFNYQFLHSFLVCSDFSSLIKNLQKLTEGSSYNLNPEAKEAEKNLKLFSLLCLQSLSQMIAFPDAVAPIIQARTLRLNKTLKYFTKFFQEADEIATKNCALTVTYQYLQPPGSELIFSLEKHLKPILCTVMGGDNDSFVFTMSDKIHAFNMNSVCDKGEFKLPVKTQPFDFMLVYSIEYLSSDEALIKDLQGGFILKSEHDLLSISFDSITHFTRRFDDELITNIFMVSPYHFLVQFANRNYFDIYNIFSGQRVEQAKFEKEIKLIEVNTLQKYVNDWGVMRKSGDGSFIIVAFEYGQIDFFHLKYSELDKKNRLDNKIYLELLCKMPQSGYDCCGLRFISDNMMSEYVFEGLVVSYNDGSVSLVSLKYKTKSISEQVLLRPKMNSTSSIKLTLMDMNVDKQLMLMLGSNGHLYLFNLDSKVEVYFFEVKGQFHYGRFFKTNMILAFSKGIIHFYAYQLKDSKIKIVELSNADAHYDFINYVFIKDMMVLTASLDSTLKVFVKNRLDRTDDLSVKFDRANNKIERLIELDDFHLISISNNSNELNVWRMENGKILKRISINEAQIICDCFYDKESGNLLIASRALKSEKHDRYDYFIYGYCLKRQQNELIDVNLKFELTFDKPIKAFKLFRLPAAQNDKFLIVAQFHSDVELQFNLISFNEMKEKQKFQIIYQAKSQTKFTELLQVSSSLCESICLGQSTVDTSLLFVSFDNEICVFDYEKRQLLHRKSLLGIEKSIDYFLSPTNMEPNQLFNITCFNATNTIVSINNIEDLEFLDYDAKSNKLKQFNSANTLMKFSDFFKISNQNLLIAYDKQSLKVVVFDLVDLRRTNSFRLTKYKISLAEDAICLNDFGFSANNLYLYTIESNRILKFHSLHNQKLKKIAELPLYSIPICSHSTNEYISISMQDNRIISFLITDPDVADCKEKIKQLESRREISEEEKEKIQDAMKNNTTILDDSSDEDDEGVEKLFIEQKKSTSAKIARLEMRRQLLKEKIEKEKVNTLKVDAADSSSDDEENFKNEKEIEDAIKKLKKIDQVKQTVKVSFSKKVFKKSFEFSKLTSNWLLDILKKNDLLDEKTHESMLEMMREKSAANKAIESLDDKTNDNPVNNSEMDQFRNELISKLVDNDKKKRKSFISTRNTGQNAQITNATTSSACSIQ